MNPDAAAPFPTPFDKPLFTIPTANFSSILTIIFFLVFVGWALYTVIVAYHWFRYGHQSWLAVPAIVAHVVISSMCILIMASGI